MAVMVRKALAAICFLTVFATAYLTVSLLILRPPRADYARWGVVATAIIAQGSLTLFALFANSRALVRNATVIGGIALAAVGAWWIRATLSGPHFEGYAVVLGVALIAQGLLTLITFAGVHDRRPIPFAP